MNENLPTQFEPEPDDSQYCRGCGDCCRWPGEVIFPPESLAPIAAWFNLDERECAERFFDLTEGRQHLRVVETADGSCPFLVEGRCVIYRLRPSACRIFPYGWRRPEKELMEQCRLYRALLWRNSGSDLP